MFKAIGRVLPPRKTSFKDYYKEWLAALKNSLLPQLHRALTAEPSSPLLAAHVDAIHQHLLSYYEALNFAAATTDNVSDLLYPEWRTALETPFLWLGDFHPYLFIHLIRSFLFSQVEEDEEAQRQEDKQESRRRSLVSFRESREYLHKSWHVATAWDCPSPTLLREISNAECGLRMMVPSLAERARKAQAAFVGRIGAEYVMGGWRTDGHLRAAVGEAMAEEMEELLNVFRDANRLRSSILSDVLSATNVHQAALFLQGLAQFIVGFHDPKLLTKFNKSKETFN